MGFISSKIYYDYCQLEMRCWRYWQTIWIICIRYLITTGVKNQMFLSVKIIPTQTVSNPMPFKGGWPCPLWPSKEKVWAVLKRTLIFNQRDASWVEKTLLSGGGEFFLGRVKKEIMRKWIHVGLFTNCMMHDIFVCSGRLVTFSLWDSFQSILRSATSACFALCQRKWEAQMIATQRLANV